jgi:glucosamine 6-phosphate synthetase-like amidotransferase/phosphosugar isomerase protein
MPFLKSVFQHSCTCRENEVLKVQLKKYVGAVQMLKREGQTAEGERELSLGRGLAHSRHPTHDENCSCGVEKWCC